MYIGAIVPEWISIGMKLLFVEVLTMLQMVGVLMKLIFLGAFFFIYTEPETKKKKKKHSIYITRKMLQNWAEL